VATGYHEEMGNLSGYEGVVGDSEDKAEDTDEDEGTLRYQN